MPSWVCSTAAIAPIIAPTNVSTIAAALNPVARSARTRDGDHGPTGLGYWWSAISTRSTRSGRFGPVEPRWKIKSAGGVEHLGLDPGEDGDVLGR